MRLAYENTTAPGLRIMLPMEKYLIPGGYFSSDLDDLCYLPIMVADTGLDTSANNRWTLGNIFMNRYYIVNSQTWNEWDGVHPF